MNDADAVFLNDEPEDLDNEEYRLGEGERMGTLYPEDARVYMQPESPGLKLVDLIGNEFMLLIVSQKLKDIFEKHVQHETEYLPLAIYNHRRRLHAPDYWVINPIGTFDCVDLNKSDVIRSQKSHEIIRIDAFVFDSRRVPAPNPGLMRVREASWFYFVSEPVAKAIHEAGCTNVRVDIVPCEP